MTIYYTVTGNPAAITRGTSSLIRSEYVLIQTAFTNVDGTFTTQTASIATKGAITGQTWTGIHNFSATTYGVTATAASNNLLLATTAYVDTAVSVLPSGTLPSVTGKNTTWNLTVNAGGTGVQWTQLVVSGTGGTTLTGNVTLTVASAASMVVTPTSPNLYATLPDATTLTAGMSQFSIYNASDYDYGVKNSTGTVLGWVRPGIGAVFGLADKSTAAGIWNLANVEKTGLTASYVNASASLPYNSTAKRVTVDANREFFMFGDASNIYGLMFDASSNTWGIPTLIRATTISNSLAILSATNQILITSCDGTTTFQAVTLTLASNAITVNTPVGVTLAGNISQIGNMVAVNGSFVTAYTRATSVIAIRGISVTGTVPTIGAESAQTPVANNIPVLLVTGTNLRVVTYDATTLYCRPYTIAGSTLTAGTQATVVISTTSMRAFVNGNGNVIAEYINSAHNAAIFKLTGTVEAVTTVTLDNNALANIGIGASSFSVISASKTLFASTLSAVNYFNILTDTAGTASVGTAISYNFTGGSIYASPTVTSNVVKLSLSSGTEIDTLSLDCSGISPVLNNIVKFFGLSNAFPKPTGQTTNFGLQDPSMLVGGAYDYCISPNQSLGQATKISANRISLVNAATNINLTVNGSTNSISWALNIIQSSSSTGIIINRIEAAT